MDAEIRAKILTLLDQHRIMTIATLRPDGWPQATTVGYANEGLTLYFLCLRDSQKAANLAQDDRVSLTIDHDTPEVMAKGLRTSRTSAATVGTPASTIAQISASLAIANRNTITGFSSTSGATPPHMTRSEEVLIIVEALRHWRLGYIFCPWGLWKG